MAFSALEKALAVAVGIDLAAPGTNRKVATAIAKQLPRVAPPVARGAAGVGRAALGGASTLARRNPYVTTGLGLAAAQQAGAFDPVTEAIEAEVERRTAQIMAPIQLAQTPLVQEQARTKVRRKVSKYQAAVKAGMKAVKASKFGGKKGKISNAKSTFGAVNKVASAVNRGKKVAKSGLKGVAARAIRKVLPKKKKAAPRKSKIDIKVNR